MEHPPSGKLTVAQLCTICGFHSNFIEDLGLLKSDTVTVLEFKNVSKETDPQHLKMKALHHFGTLGYSDQTTQHHSPETLNPHYPACQDFPGILWNLRCISMFTRAHHRHLP